MGFFRKKGAEDAPVVIMADVAGEWAAIGEHADVGAKGGHRREDVELFTDATHVVKVPPGWAVL